MRAAGEGPAEVERVKLEMLPAVSRPPLPPALPVRVSVNGCA